MAEYIEREVLKERITAEKDAHDTDTPYLVAYNNGLTMAYAMVVAMPTADVEVVKHGRWVSLTECANEGVYCSVCYKKVYKADYAWCNKKNKVRSNYCPNCGAKMDLEVQ